MKDVLCALFISSIALLTGCPNTNPSSGFQGGVRVAAYENIDTIGNSDFPVPGANYDGFSSGTIGPGNLGTLTAVLGVTGANGIADNYGAVTDVDWNMSLNMADVIPVCTNTANSSMYIPPHGGVFSFTCTNLWP